MRPQNELALIVAYYLSRTDKKGYSSLGYKSFREATRKIGEILDVKSNTIKNMRDEFDPYHQNSRIGWQRELRGSRQKILQSFQNTDGDTLYEIVKEILSNKEFNRTEEYKDIHTLFAEEKPTKSKKTQSYILRGPTGRAAELFFQKYFKETGLPKIGELVDCRDQGCGYDFEIKNSSITYYVEVKGLANKNGGVLFTNKEWQTAQKFDELFYLVIVKNVATTPEITIIQNPSSKLKATKNIYTTLQVCWSVTAKNLS